MPKGMYSFVHPPFLRISEYVYENWWLPHRDNHVLWRQGYNVNKQATHY